MTQESLNESAAKPNNEDAAAQTSTETKASDVEAKPPAEEGAKPEGEAPKAEGAKEGTEPSAPENYDIKFGEGFTPDPELLGEFSEIAKEAKLPAETAQKIAGLSEKLVQRMVDRQLEALNSTYEGWKTELRNDKEFGGEKLDANLAIAKKAVETFVPKEALSILEPFDPVNNPNGLGLGNHPAFVKMMHNIGKSISEDSVVVTSRSTGQKPSLAERLYGKQNQS